MKIFFTFILISFTFFMSCEKAELFEDINAEMNIGLSTIPQHEHLACWDEEDPIKGKSVVFIAGFDEDDNTYYANAKTHFSQQNYQVVTSLFSVNEITQWLASQKGIWYDQIHIVSHSNPWRGMSLQTAKNGDRITLESLNKYLADTQIPEINGINNDTKIIFHSCGLGENKALLSKLGKAFQRTTNPQLIASPYFNVFGGKYASHYLAKPYYVFYPTAQSKGPFALSQEIARSHPDKNINWIEALTTREEQGLGEVYSYRFNIPVTWEIAFNTASEIPILETPDDIMDFIAEDEAMATTLFEMKIPLEKYRWSVKQKGNTLKISGKTTALCVLEPVMNREDEGNYATLTISDKKLYTHL